MLRVNVKQAKGNLTKNSNAHRRIIHEGTTLAICRDFPTQDAFRRLIIKFVFLEECLHIVAFYVEEAFDGALGSTRHDASCVGSLAHKQAESTKDNGLAGSRFACHYREA